jgi:ABC-2 type transport system permease protein
MAEPDSATARARVPLGWGWRVVAAKELADHLLSIRFTILVILVGLAAVAAVYNAAGGIRDAAEQASGDPTLFLRLFTLSQGDIPSFLALVAVLVPLLGIAFGFDAINGERAQGTLPRLLSQPIHRDDVVNGKFVAGLGVIGVILSILTLIVAGVGLVRLGVVPSAPEVGRLLLYLFISCVYAGFWLGLATLLSVVFRRAATSALAVMAAWLVITFFAGLLIRIVAGFLVPVPEGATIQEEVRSANFEQTLSRVFPATLYGEATTALLVPEQRTFEILGVLILQGEERAIPSGLSVDQSLLLVWPQITVLMGLVVVCFAGAYILFMRQEVRA